MDLILILNKSLLKVFTGDPGADMEKNTYPCIIL